MSAPLSGVELQDAVRQLVRDLKVIDSAILRLNVINPPRARWSIGAIKGQLVPLHLNQRDRRHRGPGVWPGNAVARIPRCRVS